MLKKIGLGFAALVSTIAIANAISGNQLGLPIIGGASYCSSFTNANCSNTVAAGPAMTGSETIIANTNIGGGASPQTGLIALPSLGAGPYQYNAPSTGATLTLTGVQRRLIVEPSTTIAGLTVVFPASTALTDAQLMGLCTTQIVTALTVTAGSGTTVLNKPTAMLVPVTTGGASCVEWVYRQSNTTWYRVQ
jgi:hypothetical protein